MTDGDTTKKYNRLRITTKKGLTFELIITDWLEEGDYEFGRVELIESLNIERAKDYIHVIESLCDMSETEDDE